MPATSPKLPPRILAEADVIVLNGTSSAGKSSLARALQHRCGVPLLHASLDVFTDMFSWDAPALAEADVRRACHTAGGDQFHRTLADLARRPFPIVVDHVLEQPAWIDATRDALASRRVYWIGVYCPPDVTAARERNRPDRRPGLAAFQATRVHAHLAYDGTVDTSLASPEDCADHVLAHLGLHATSSCANLST